MKVDLSCPIELRGYSLTYTENTVNAVVRLHNLARKRIASFEAVAKWRSSASGRSLAAPFCAERLRAGGENGFTISLSCDKLTNADCLEVLFTAVRFEDGEDEWRAGEGVVVEIAPIGTIEPENLTMLRAVAGEDTVCFPHQDNHAWRCVCGRANVNSADSCSCCHRSRFAVLAHTPENVRIQYENLTPASAGLEDAALTAELHTRFMRHRARLLRRTIAMAVAVLALTTLLVLKYSPENAIQPPAETMTIEN